MIVERELEVKRQHLASAAAIIASSALVLSACGEAPEESGSAGGGGGDNADYKACIVSDAGGWDDKSFNQSAKEGLDMAVEELGIESAEAESNADSDFGPNVDNMISQGCNITLGVGFLLEGAVHEAAEANSDLHFGLVDATFTDEDSNPVELDNGKPIIFNTAEAAYLAGYLAAGMSESGTVATFGGIQIPSVTIFMDGFADGVAKYNEDNGDDEVKLLGWDKEDQSGSFSGDFDNQSQGQALTEQFISQGADIIMPVAGPVGLGAASAAKAAGDTKIVWVDQDGYESTEYGDIILTTVQKEIATAVKDTIAQDVEGNFSADPYVGTLENGGVDLAPYHDFEDEVPAELDEKVQELKEQIIAGDIVVESPSTP
ncbi:BMP family ABC transporter substrate-binding protein [Brevibacterium salitolerans]|uniref:BMP family ABC transporter substrate-binding protein n=1 Tax=Brevibacterium salitolerans TaxID=1403566 RepID=A0ABN2WYM7_9MICO